MTNTIVIDLNGMDGDQHTAHYDDFVSLAESPCGFGDTKKMAVLDLLEQCEP